MSEVTDIPVSEEVRYIKDQGRQEAWNRRYDTILPEHLLLAIVKDDELSVNVLMRTIVVNFDSFRALLESTVPVLQEFSSPSELPYSFAAKRIVELAGEEAASMGSDMVEDYHLFLAMLKQDSVVSRLLKRFGFLYEEIRPICEHAASLSV